MAALPLQCGAHYTASKTVNGQAMGESANALWKQMLPDYRPPPDQFGARRQHDGTTDHDRAPLKNLGSGEPPHGARMPVPRSTISTLATWPASCRCRA